MGTEPSVTFEEFLITVGLWSVDYPNYGPKFLASKIKYLRESWENNISVYKTLEFLYYEIP